MRVSTAIKITVALLVLSWLPLIIVGALGISDNPIGLGLLAMAGTMLAAVWLGAFALYRILFFS
ncbi:MAG: hypothetical protein M9924_04280 [Rhizobiaceae bacterium]|nr:hypothetical protein [Rhizobiaceae bacterium]